jgi:cytochrome P450
MTKNIKPGPLQVPYEMQDAYRDKPFTLLKELRDDGGVHFDEIYKRYIFTDYKTVRSNLRSRELLTNPHSSKKDSWIRGGLREGISSGDVNMLYADEPEHRRLRNLVNDIFTPKAAEQWRERIGQVVDEHLDAIVDDEFDLIAAFAGPIPTIIIAEMMGISLEHREDFIRWSDAKVKSWGKPGMSEVEIAEARGAQVALEQFFSEQVQQRRKKPAGDMISQMIAAEFDGDKLSDEDIIAQCDLLLVGGIATSTDMISNGIKALLTNPEQLKLLRDNPDKIEAAVEEILRYDTPVPATSRISHADIKIKGCPIDKGEALHNCIAGANRDPTVFINPDSFDIEREYIPHQSFGGGRHYCLGVSLARVEGQEAILRLIQRFPKLRLSSRGFDYTESVAFRGMSYFWLRKS